jgi:hypothetical protein
MLRTIILNVIYGCETGSVTVRVEHKLWLFKNKVLSKVSELKRDYITGYRRKLHNVELCDLYLAPVIIPVMRSRRKVCPVTQDSASCNLLLVIAHSIVIWPHVEQMENLGLIPNDGGDMQVCSRDI